MNTASFDELTGRIDGIGQALLRVVTALEMGRLIDGPRIAAEWRGARPAQLATDAKLRSSHQVLQQLADLLDEARQARLAHESARQ